MTSAKTSTALAKMAGDSSGSSTWRRALTGEAPRSMAASSYSRPIDSSRARQLGRGPQLDRLEQVGEQELQGHGEQDLGEHERHQHLEVEPGGQPAVPAVEADGEGDPDGHGHQGGQAQA